MAITLQYSVVGKSRSLRRFRAVFLNYFDQQDGTAHPTQMYEQLLPLGIPVLKKGATNEP